MSTTRRGVSQFISGSSATTHHVPLPAGSAVGDWVILAASTQAFAATFTLPGTELLNAGNTTMRYGLASKQLDATDISNGYLSVGVPSNQKIAAVIVGYSASGGFGVHGTVWAKDGVSLAYTNAPSVASDGTQDILVFSLIKHSGNPQSFTSNTPTTTSLASIWSDGSGQPGAHVGVYTGAAADRTSTWSVASTNGVGFQVAVNHDSVGPPSVFHWDTGSLVSAGAVTTGTVNESVVNSYALATFPQDNASDYFTWSTGGIAAYTARYYITLPNAWSATSMSTFIGLRSGSSNQRLTLTGLGDPGRIRLVGPSNTTITSSPGGGLVVSTTYRLEIQADTAGSKIRAAIFPLGSDTPLWDSGEQSYAIGGATQNFSFGKTATLATLSDFSISRIKVIPTYGSWIGRHASDGDSTYETLGVYSGTLSTTETLGVWDGSVVVPVEIIKTT